MLTKETFNGGVAVITGAGSGIGEALSLYAASCGMKVVVAELSEERGQKVAQAINDNGGEAIFVKTDVSDRKSVKALADKTFSTYGEVRLLVNNAGISVMGKILDITDESWDRALDVNLRGTIAGIQYFVPKMIEAGKPAYVCNLGSLASFSMATSQSAYFCTKHAILSLSEGLYLEMQEDNHPINVSMAAPGFITTRIFEDSLKTEASVELTNMIQDAATNLGMSPPDAAKIILDGIAAKKFVISTHPDFTAGFAIERGEYLSDVNERMPVPSNAEAIFSKLN